MTCLEDIRSEIAAKVAASHPRIILDALDRLLREIAGAHQDVRSGVCTYHVHFQTYAKLCSSITFLQRMFDNGLFGADAIYRRSRAQEHASQPVEVYSNVEHRLNVAANRLHSLRMKRYENVCKECAACRTRRKRWPERTQFIPVTDSLAARIWDA
jgi:hypothetical protein